MYQIPSSRQLNGSRISLSTTSFYVLNASNVIVHLNLTQINSTNYFDVSGHRDFWDNIGIIATVLIFVSIACLLTIICSIIYFCWIRRLGRFSDNPSYHARLHYRKYHDMSNDPTLGVTSVSMPRPTSIFLENAYHQQRYTTHWDPSRQRVYTTIWSKSRRASASSSVRSARYTTPLLKDRLLIPYSCSLFSMSDYRSPALDSQFTASVASGPYFTPLQSPSLAGLVAYFRAKLGASRNVIDPSPYGTMTSSLNRSGNVNFPTPVFHTIVSEALSSSSSRSTATKPATPSTAMLEGVVRNMKTKHLVNKYPTSTPITMKSVAFMVTDSTDDDV